MLSPVRFFSCNSKRCYLNDLKKKPNFQFITSTYVPNPVLPMCVQCALNTGLYTMYIVLCTMSTVQCRLGLAMNPPPYHSVGAVLRQSEINWSEAAQRIFHTPPHH